MRALRSAEAACLPDRAVDMATLANFSRNRVLSTTRHFARRTPMSIFGNIMSAIFGRGTAQATPRSPDSPASTSAPPLSPASAPSASPSQSVDVEAVLNERAANNKQKLNWRTSIVDLMKLLDLDSSLTARKQLAQELHYSGDMNDSAAMNIWLHKQVMKKLAENGGKVPADLKA
jgi:hypothetical protein